jgi:hypothetical protein
MQQGINGFLSQMTFNVASDGRIKDQVEFIVMDPMEMDNGQLPKPLPTAIRKRSANDTRAIAIFEAVDPLPPRRNRMRPVNYRRVSKGSHDVLPLFVADRKSGFAGSRAGAPANPSRSAIRNNRL